jgi:hypothetical protein
MKAKRRRKKPVRLREGGLLDLSQSIQGLSKYPSSNPIFDSTGAVFNEAAPLMKLPSGEGIQAGLNTVESGMDQINQAKNNIRNLNESATSALNLQKDFITGMEPGSDPLLSILNTLTPTNSLARQTGGPVSYSAGGPVKGKMKKRGHRKPRIF